MLPAILLLLPLPQGPAEPAPDPTAADRRAILAMAGAFEVAFRFEETVACEPGYALRAPYTANATELVEVVADEPGFISLQHVLLLDRERAGDGAGPHVIKHWRQDWTYEDGELLPYRGYERWVLERPAPERRRGAWSQAVFEVSDAPRYEALGRWTHTGACSAWESEETWRPLPRREYTQRMDYDVLVSRNRHTLTPAGWVHEQDSRKLVLAFDGTPERVLAHERGLNTYTRVGGERLQAAEDYWERTAPFWREVRRAWAAELAGHAGPVRIEPALDGRRLSDTLLGLAPGPDTGPDPSGQETSGPRLRELIAAYIH